MFGSEMLETLPLSLTWSIGALPIDWVGGFQSLIPSTLDMNREALVPVGLDVPGELPVGMMDVTVPVIVGLITPGIEELVTHTFQLNVEITPSIFVELSPDSMTLNDINSGSSGTFIISVTNFGNQPSG